MKCAYSVLLLTSLLGAVTCLFEEVYSSAPIPLSWVDAQTYCRTNYVDLISFHSERDIEFFLSWSVTSDPGQYWTGLRKSPNALQFTQWSDGSPLSFTSWKKEQPRDVNVNHCVTINVETGDWSTSTCTSQLSFFCYSWYPEIILVQDPKTWDEALTHCRKFYIDLISLTTETDIIAVNWVLSNQKTNVWTGLRFMDGSWFWTNHWWSLVSLTSCPDPAYRCGAVVPGTDILENRDCMEKLSFLCYTI